MSGSGAPWALYAIGAVLAVVLNFCKIPAACLRTGYVHPAGAEHAATDWRSHQLVRRQPQQGHGAEQCARGKKGRCWLPGSLPEAH